MAKINYNLLRQRIHWVDDYAAGITWSDILAELNSEGSYKEGSATRVKFDIPMVLPADTRDG